jgi:hypothetical protein
MSRQAFLVNVDHGSLSQVQQLVHSKELQRVIANLAPGQLVCSLNSPTHQTVLHWAAPVPRPILEAVFGYIWNPQRMALSRPQVFDCLQLYFSKYPLLYKNGLVVAQLRPALERLKAL